MSHSFYCLQFTSRGLAAAVASITFPPKFSCEEISLARKVFSIANLDRVYCLTVLHFCSHCFVDRGEWITRFTTLSTDTPAHAVRSSARDEIAAISVSLFLKCEKVRFSDCAYFRTVFVYFVESLDYALYHEAGKIYTSVFFIYS